MLVLFEPTYIGFVGLDFAGEFLEVWCHSLAESVHEVPGGSLSDAQLFSELDTADSFAGDVDEIHGVKPLAKGNARVLEDGVCTDGKAFAAGVAMVAVFGGQFASIVGVAARADNAIGPALSFEEVDGGLFVRDELKEVEGAGKFSVRVSDFGSHKAAERETALCAGLLSRN